jgi:hypothetical protein
LVNKAKNNIINVYSKIGFQKMNNLFSLKALNVNISDIMDVERMGGLINKSYRMTIAGRETAESERKRIKIHKIMQDVFRSMWAVAKGDDNLSDYALERFTRGKVNLLRYFEGRSSI